MEIRIVKLLCTFLSILFVFALNFKALHTIDELQEEITYSEKLDSIITYSSDTNLIRDKQHFIYDEKGNILEQSYYSFEDEMLLGEEKNLMSYDDNSNIIQEINQEWDYNTNDWKNNDKTEYEYDNMNNNTEIIEYSWFKQTSEWFEQDKREYEYDDDNNLIWMLSFDKQSDEWVPVSKKEYEYENGMLIKETSAELILEEWQTQIQIFYEYDMNENLVLYQLYYKFSSDLEPFIQEEYHYDNDNNLTEMIVSRATSSGDWENDRKYEYFYDSGNLIKSEESYYNDATEEWYPLYKEEMEYDNYGYMIFMQEFQYDRDEEVWNSYEKSEYEYDEYGNMLSSIFRADDYEDGTWRFGTKDEIEIDYSVELSEVMINEMLKDMFVHKPVSGTTSFWSVDEQEWNEYFDIELYYSQAVTSVAEKGDISIFLFPNPSQDKIKISGLSEIANLDIYSVSGEQLISKRILPGEEINISGFSSGTYIYNVRIKGEQLSGKFIKY